MPARSDPSTGTLGAARVSPILARLPATLLRLEGAAVFGSAIAVYLHADYNVLALVLLFFAPDLSLLGYLAGRRAGAVTYNAVHTELWPIILAATGVLAGASVLSQVGLIWLTHIGIDRLLGYGLKYPTAFKDTHLGRV